MKDSEIMTEENQFFMKDLFGKVEQVSSFLQICSHFKIFRRELENFICFVVFVENVQLMFTGKLKLFRLKKMWSKEKVL